MKKIIQTTNAPQAIGPYSQAVCVGKTIYFSGQIPLSPLTLQLVAEDFVMQATQVFTNLNELTKAAGGDLNSIVKLTVYLTDLGYFPTLNEIMLSFFKPPFPARTTIQVSALPKASKIEIDAIMELK